MDVARAVSGKAPIFTAHHVVRGGECWSRIDQIYVPAEDDVQYELGPPGDFFQSRSQVEIDHSVVDVRTVRVKPTKGNDLPHINETIFDDPIFIHKLHNKITEIAAQVNPAQAEG